ncbi:MFS transporter [Streptomyces sioyaensis]|uniref:MFS transporter n=1 Tax=Streptomyces sioyaensis TaxID=67364 RepID=UPI0037A26804
MGGTTLGERVERTGPPATGATAGTTAAPARPAAHHRPGGHDPGSGPGPGPGAVVPPGPRRPRRVRLVLLLGLMPALLLAALGQTVVAPALPEIAGELHGLDAMSWPVTSSLLAAALGLPLFGRLGDVVGRKPALLLALLVFTAGSALAGWSRTMDELVLFRAVQGAGGGGLVIGVQAIVAEAVPPRARGRFMGLIGAAFGLAAVAGPLVGGLCTDRASWRWCLWLDVPFGVPALLLTAVALKLPRPARRAKPDFAGGLLLAACATCLALLTRWGGTAYAWDSRVVLGLGAGALGTALLFVAVEYFAAAPLLPLRLFRDPAFRVTGPVGAAVGIALFGVASYLPAFAQRADGAGATASGLLMLPLMGGLVLASLVSGLLARRTGYRRVLPVLGCAVAAVGVWLLLRMPENTPREVSSLWTGVLGLGLGCVLPVLVRAVRNPVRPAGLATATRTTFSVRQFGGSVGAALFGTLLADRLARRLGDRPPRSAALPDPESLTPLLVRALPAPLRDGYAAASAHVLPGIFCYLVPVLVLGPVLAFFLKEKPLVSHAPHAPQASTTPQAPYGDPADPAAVPQARTATATDAVNSRDSGPTYPRMHRHAAGVPAAPAGVPVCGTVQHHDGSIVPRAALTLIDVAGRQIGRGATGEDGRYALSTPGAGSYVLIAAAGGHQPQAVTVTVGERPVELDVVLGGAGRLAGTVTTADGTPVRDAMVTLTDVRGEVVATTRSGREGGYVIGDLVAGEYTLASSAPAFRPAALPVTVQASRETRQDIELAGGAVLRGTVRAGGGRLVEDARVTLLDAAGNVVDTAITGSDGLFRFVDLSAGEYTVIAAGYPPVATVLQVAGGGRTERDLQLGHED